MCTPKGVASDSGYNNPASPLFNQTDPTLKQFGINQKTMQIEVDSCSRFPAIDVFASVRSQRVWLELVAWPVLQNVTRFRRLERERYDDCMQNMAWEDVKKEAGMEVKRKHKNLVCKAVVAYTFCLLHSPKMKHCRHLQTTFLDAMIKVDLQEQIRLERCRLLSTVRPRHALFTPGKP